MKQPTIEFNIETGSCPRCKGHAFQRSGITRMKVKIFPMSEEKVKVTLPNWTCMHCGLQIVGYIFIDHTMTQNDTPPTKDNHT